MKRKYPPVWLCALILALALGWRILGAPVTAEQFERVEMSLWQTRILLPARITQIFHRWHGTYRQNDAAVLNEMMPIEGELAQENRRVNVYLVQENKLVEMTLDGYVCGVVAAEMPAQYHLEALKAQAVAARTRVLKQKEDGGCVNHPGADICTDSAHCQGYATLSECRQLWQDSYEAYRDRIHMAEKQTRYEVLTYKDELITVLYHAMSGGRTEDAATVFSQRVPYLVSVESSGEETANGFWRETYFTYEQIAQMLNTSAGMKMTGQDVRRTLAIGSYTETGRVNTVQIGDQEIKGVDFRRALGLRSTWFSLSTDENGIVFHQRGYGHGVGMSQVGANSMAANGNTYAEILMHYYPGTALEKR